MTIGGEPPLLPEAPPTPPGGAPVERGVVEGFLLALGYDPRWVVQAQISPRHVDVDVVTGELHPILIHRRHPIAGPEPVPDPGPRR